MIDKCIKTITPTFDEYAKFSKIQFTNQGDLFLFHVFNKIDYVKPQKY
jgi:hypothetical protein